MILNLDPSLSATGFSIVSNHKGDYLENYGVICAKTKLKKSYGLAERATQMAEGLNDLFKVHDIMKINTEIPVGSKSSAAAKALALCQGVVMTIAQVHGVEIELFEARDVKKFLTDDFDGSKELVIEKVAESFPQILTIDTKYKQEAVADSLGIYLYSQSL